MIEMKDSGVEWIGKIPKNWEYTKLKLLYSFEKGKNAAIYTQEYIGMNRGQYPVYSGQTENGGIMGKIKTYDYDLDSCVFTTTVGAKVMSPRILSGKFSLSQNCLIMNRIQITDDRFTYYVLTSLFDYEKSLIPSYMQPSLRIEDLKRYAYFMPNFKLQKAIADYLDNKCSKIDAIIECEQTVIDKLKEYKLSVITEAVTKGLNPNVEMKDSGVEWIGSMPNIWKIGKINSIGQTASGATPTRNKDSEYFIEDADIRWVRTLDLNDGEVWDSSENISLNALKSSSCSIMPIDTVCVAMYGGAGTIGKCGILKKECTTNQAICSIVCNDNLNPKYLLFQLLALRKYWMKYAVGTRKDPNISQDIVKKMKVIIPPISEQENISYYLSSKCAQIDKSIETKESVITKLTEYKKSLIYEVVTGKKEV